ncbi:hypothetical protein Tco_0598190 [Tanacetum coccineum]
MVENVSGAASMNVPSVGKATASPAEGEKNTKDANTNLKDELIDLLGKNVVTHYYTKKLLFDKYYDKMLKRKKIPKIIKCEVLTKKGPITLKIYREDGFNEVISNLKVIDLHLGEWREVIQACPNKSMALDFDLSFPAFPYRDRFATMVENASGATSMNVPLAGKATASPAKGEKNTKDAEANMQKQLIDLLGIKVVEQYHSKKLLFDKYCDKMLKRKKSPKITNCEILTKKGPIT